MKNSIIVLALSFIFLVISAFGIDSGAGVVVTVVGKTSAIVCTFQVPNKYVQKDGTLSVPIEFELIQNGKTSVIFKSNCLETVLPNANLNGKGQLTLRVGAFISSQTITL